ncbi:MAG: NAD(P)-dependent oxidoreductase [Pseudomonadota bacterium]
MKSFPMFIRTTDRCVVIVGGGEAAAQKARLILKTDAALILVAPTLDPELADLVATGRATHHQCLSAGLFTKASFAFVATGCPGFDAAAYGLARAANCLVNVVDRPEMCEITTPAIVDRDPLVVAIGSEGTAPVLTRDVKSLLERLLSPNIGGLAALAGRLRPVAARHVPRENRRGLWAWALKGPPRAAWLRGAEREAARSIKDAILSGGPPQDAMAGQIAIIEAGSGASDLMTLRAVSRLQEADVIFHDAAVSEAVLELARRDAERVALHTSVCGWPAARTGSVILAQAREGRHVVRLCAGPAEDVLDAELAALHDPDIRLEIVPGVCRAIPQAQALCPVALSEAV